VGEGGGGQNIRSKPLNLSNSYNGQQFKRRGRFLILHACTHAVLQVILFPHYSPKTGEIEDVPFAHLGSWAVCSLLDRVFCLLLSSPSSGLVPSS
jgi:hypothetical protein